VVVQGGVDEAIPVAFIQESFNLGGAVKKLKELLKLRHFDVHIVVLALLKDSHRK